MGFLSHGRLLCVAACAVWWACGSLVAAQGTNTTGQALWPDYVNYPGNTTANRYVYFSAISFPYYECKTISINIRSTGYVSFGPDYDAPEPPQPAEWPYLQKLLGVFWSKLTPYTFKPNSSMFVYTDIGRLYNVTYENSLIRYVKNVISEPDFEPLSVVAATWQNIRPSTNDNDTATFQVLLATDSQVTYAIRAYQSVWENPELANVTYYAATYSLGYGDRPEIVLPGSQPGPEVIRLGTKKPNKEPYSCVEKTQTIVSRLNSSLYSLPPCPCYEVQASKDPQFNISATAPRCYQSIIQPPGGSLFQLCCYNKYGHLLNYTKEARVPVPADTNDRSLQEALDICCAEGSALCAWFQRQIYLTKCLNYTPAFNKSQLPRFTSSEADVVYYRTTEIIVGISVENSTGVRYSLETTFNSSHGLSLGGIGYMWTIASALNELRQASYPQLFVIYATDANNMSAAFAPLYKLCLCQDKNQCQKDNAFANAASRDKDGISAFFGLDSYLRGNVNVMPCQCKGNGTGKFCEKPVNACDNCLVQNTSGCNSNPQDYCPTCPSGYQRSGTQCLDMVQPLQITTTPRDGGQKTDSVDLLVVLSCITSYTLWMQDFLNTRM